MYKINYAAVLQVPAYFDEDQKNATITAGKIAGLQTVRLIRQCPTQCVNSMITTWHCPFHAMMCLPCAFSLHSGFSVKGAAAVTAPMYAGRNFPFEVMFFSSLASTLRTSWL